MKVPLAARAWGVTLALVLAGVIAVAALLRTGAPPEPVGAGVVALAYLAYVSWRSGGRFEFEARNGRPPGPADPPAFRHALLDVCERAGRPVPALVVVRMDVPGAIAGYDDGAGVLAVDPRLLNVIGPEGLRAILAHELGHLGRDIHTDAIRAYLPQLVGFGTFWTVLLAGRGPAIASVGSLLYLGLAPVSDRRIVVVRGVLSVGAEPLALAGSRYANRLEEYRADAYAATLVSPAAMTEALYRIAAVATGDNDEDVAGPIPWNDDRSRSFEAFATHPTIENRAAALGCTIPDWARPRHPEAGV